MDFVVSKTALGLLITKHLTIDQIAERSGLSISCIKEVVSGSCNPRLSTLEKIADAINLRLDFMFSQVLRQDTPDKNLVREYIAAIRKFEQLNGEIDLGRIKHDFFDNVERDNNAAKGISKKQFGFLCSIIHKLPTMAQAKAVLRKRLAK